ncbi:hypothetical protein [Jonesia denitrificans]|uniref:Uncharacterized protein n=2 Tax=Jonesia TaxID=43673 RepID=C7R2G0_JONDD|nr:hypothetical protein [Jonesia denitrificans]ACV08531.1 hypothetical protein Jden_0869 [Jonesia denitrificans DSM 20603]
MNNLLLAQAIFIATSFIITQSTTSSEDTRVAWGDNSVSVSKKDKSHWITDIPNAPKKDGGKTAEREVSNSPKMQNGLLQNGVTMGFCSEGVVG